MTSKTRAYSYSYSSSCSCSCSSSILSITSTSTKDGKINAPTFSCIRALRHIHLVQLLLHSHQFAVGALGGVEQLGVRALFGDLPVLDDQ